MQVAIVMASISASSSRRSSDQVEELFDRARMPARVSVMNGCGKESMKRQLARSPWTRIIADNASSPARASACGGMISSLAIGGYAL
jgi:hypothetical protein